MRAASGMDKPPSSTAATTRARNAVGYGLIRLLCNRSQAFARRYKGKEQLPPAVLVGARVDRGAPALSQQELDQFCQHYAIRGGYLSASALSGEGLEALLQTLKAQIPW